MTIEKCHRCVGDSLCENQVAEECLPVGAFGNLLNKSVEAVTIGLNPALNEFYEQGYKTLKPETQRLAVLSDYQTTSRASLSAVAVKKAKDRQREYFTAETRECHLYFSRLQPQISRLNSQWTFASGNVVHIDLAACATRWRWGLLPELCQMKMRNNCRDNFLIQLSALQTGTVLLPANTNVVKGMEQIGLMIHKLNMTIILKPEVARRWLGILEIGGKKFPVLQLS